MAGKREKPEVRRGDILESAMDLFIEKGYHGASMRLIAHRAGVTEGLIYHYFDNKEALFDAIVDKYIFLRDKVLAHVRLDLTLEENMRLAADWVGSAATDSSSGDHPPFIRKFLAMMMLVTPTMDHERRRRIAGRIEQGASLIVGLLENKIATGEIRPVDSYLATRLLMSGIIGCFFIHDVMQVGSFHEMDFAKYYEVLTSIFCGGLALSAGTKNPDMTKPVEIK